MKQRINVEQLKQLTPQQQENLRKGWNPKEGDWWKPAAVDSEELLVNHQKECCVGDHCGFGPLDEWFSGLKELCLPLLSVGQCIELLESEYPTLHINKHLPSGLQTWIEYDVFQQGLGSFRGKELIDALWEAVKEVLRKG